LSKGKLTFDRLTSNMPARRATLASPAAGRWLPGRTAGRGSPQPRQQRRHNSRPDNGPQSTLRAVPISTTGVDHTCHRSGRLSRRNGQHAVNPVARRPAADDTQRHRVAGSPSPSRTPAGPTTGGSHAHDGKLTWRRNSVSSSHVARMRLHARLMCRSASRSSLSVKGNARIERRLRGRIGRRPLEVETSCRSYSETVTDGPIRYVSTGHPRNKSGGGHEFVYLQKKPPPHITRNDLAVVPKTGKPPTAATASTAPGESRPRSVGCRSSKRPDDFPSYGRRTT